MTKEELKSLKFFTETEIALTGGNFKDVQCETFQRLELFRKEIGCKVYLLRNGLTSGEHESPEHLQGKAVDIRLEIEKPPNEVFKIALQAGFKGFGIYWNSIMYSYHLHIGKDFKFWSAIKKPSGEGWIYFPLLIDPKHIKNNSIYLK